MRPLIILLMSVTICCFACQSPGQTDRKDKDSPSLKGDSAGHRSASTAVRSDSSVDVIDSIVLSKLKLRFSDSPIPFEGLWVSERYVNDIRKGKPLRKAQDTETRCIVIPGRTLQVTSWIYGFHEGGENVAVLKSDYGYFTYALYRRQVVDTLEALADGRLRIGRRYFIRLGENDSTLSDLGVLEQLLFMGQYRRLNDTGTAVFENDGKIEGLDSLCWYEPVIDYADFPTNIDHIRLGRDKEHLKDYGLRVVGDTMMINSIDCLKFADGDCVLDTLGRQMYALKKLK
jgi:hypothetical protein